MLKTLNRPIPIHDDDETLLADCMTFLQYARCMMYPDPLGVEINDDVHDALTDLINAGLLTAWEALKTHNEGYRFDDYGREYIEFPDIHALPKRLHTLYPNRFQDEARLEPAAV